MVVPSPWGGGMFLRSDWLVFAPETPPKGWEWDAILQSGFAALKTLWCVFPVFFGVHVGGRVRVSAKGAKGRSGSMETGVVCVAGGRGVGESTGP